MRPDPKPCFQISKVKRKLAFFLEKHIRHYDSQRLKFHIKDISSLGHNMIAIVHVHQVAGYHNPIEIQRDGMSDPSVCLFKFNPCIVLENWSQFWC